VQDTLVSLPVPSDRSPRGVTLRTHRPVGAATNRSSGQRRPVAGNGLFPATSPPSCAETAPLLLVVVGVRYGPRGHIPCDDASRRRRWRPETSPVRTVGAAVDAFLARGRSGGFQSALVRSDADASRGRRRCRPRARDTRSRRAGQFGAVRVRRCASATWNRQG
jgi:hypothetical protein